MTKTLLAALVTLCGACVPEDGGDAKAGDGLGDEDKDGAHEDQVTNRVCADGATTKGIDVSYYQETIDWAAVKRDGVDFAFIRVSDGEVFKDPKFVRNWANAKTAGVVRGTYQYFRPNQDVDAQVKLLVDAVGTYAPGDLPPVIDVEATGGLSPSAVAKKVEKWVAGVQSALGVAPIVYTGKYFWRDQVGGDKNLADNPLWIAQYTSRCPDIPAPWQRWGFWQHTDKGTVAGIRGPVDMDTFNGSLADLQAFASGAALPGATAALPYYSGRSGNAVSFVATPPDNVTSVEIRIDDYSIGTATPSGGQAVISWTWNAQRTGRAVEVRGYDASGALVALGNGLIDSTPGDGFFADETGDAEYEIGFDGYSDTVEVIADGVSLTDIDTGTTRSRRGMVRYKFSQTGPRALRIIARDSGGGVIADQMRSLTVR